MDLPGFGEMRDSAKVGLTLADAKKMLARLQEAVVATQAADHSGMRPDCPACGRACHVKDGRSRQVATLFGTVTVPLPRFRCSAAVIARRVSIGTHIAGRPRSLTNRGRGCRL
jgi:hypothetical protein